MDPISQPLDEPNIYRTIARERYGAGQERAEFQIRLTAARRRKRNKLFEVQKGLCHYCTTLCFIPETEKAGRRRDAATLEHLKPLARGGRDNMRNLVMACYECNNERQNDDDPEEFLTCQRNPELRKARRIRRDGDRYTYRQGKLEGKKERQDQQIVKLAFLMLYQPSFVKISEGIVERFSAQF